MVIFNCVRNSIPAIHLIVSSFIDKNCNRRNWYWVSDGVPQGSILKPLPFDILHQKPKRLSTLLKTYMKTTKDTQLYYHCFHSKIKRSIDWLLIVCLLICYLGVKPYLVDEKFTKSLYMLLLSSVKDRQERQF